jgi:hypothetical protein
MDEQKITAGLLTRLMSDISEDRWCAGWLGGLEYMLWDAVVGRRKAVCSSEEIEQLKYLSEKCRGWIIWDDQAKGEKFVPIEDWLRLYEADRHKRSESDE